MQLLHDAALIGQAVKDGTAKPCLANQRFWPGDRNSSREGEMCGMPMEAHLERQTKGQESNRLCKTNSEAQELTMTDIHPVQIYGRTAQEASTAQVNALWKDL